MFEGRSINAITNGRFSSLMTRLFWMKEAGAAAPTLAPEIAPSFDVNQQDDPTLWFLRGERLCGGASSLAPSAGLYTISGLQNPVNSGMIAVIRGASIRSDVLGTIYGRITNAGVRPQGSATRFFLDGRWGFAPRPVCFVTQDNNIQPVIAESFAADVIPAVTEIFDLPMYRGIVLPPGWRVDIGHATITTPTLTNSIQWIERPIALEEQSTG